MVSKLCLLTHEYGWWINTSDKDLIEENKLQQMKQSGYNDTLINLIKVDAKKAVGGSASVPCG